MDLIRMTDPIAGRLALALCLAAQPAFEAVSSQAEAAAQSAPGTAIHSDGEDIPNQPRQQSWNWHIQNTDIIQGDPGFQAKYSGPNSLDSKGEIRETVSIDLFSGVRLWHGAEAHVDGLMWQG